MRQLRGLLAATALAITGPLLIEAAIAAPSNSAVLAAISDASGWTHYADHKGVTVYEKHISIVDMPAYKGVTTVDVDSEFLFGIICDLPDHINISDTLAASKVLAQIGDKTHYYQVTDTPMLMPIADRYWFNEARVSRDVTGPGHHIRTWSPLNAELYPEAFSAVKSKYPDAVYVTKTYGFWEVQPAGPGKTKLTHTSLTHPGGNVPDSVFETLSARALPDNMLGFVNEARARAGG